MSKRQKTHQIVVTVSHDQPVTQREAVRMFRDAHCWPKNDPALYYGDVWRNDAGVVVGEGGTVRLEASFRSVKAFKP